MTVYGVILMNWRKVSLFIAKDHSVIVFLDAFCLFLCLCDLSADNESKMLSLKKNPLSIPSIHMLICFLDLVAVCLLFCEWANLSRFIFLLIMEAGWRWVKEKSVFETVKCIKLLTWFNTKWSNTCACLELFHFSIVILVGFFVEVVQNTLSLKWVPIVNKTCL